MSNEATPNITIEEFFEPSISISDNKIHLFFGKSPRAQLIVTIDDVKNSWKFDTVGLVKTKFPMWK